MSSYTDTGSLGSVGSVGSLGSVCFRRNDFNLYVFLIFCIVMYLCYIVKKTRDNIQKQLQNHYQKAGTKEGFRIQQDTDKEDDNEDDNENMRLQNEIFTYKTSLQKCNLDLQQIQQLQSQTQTQTNSRQSLNRIYNPLVPPERAYPSGRFNQPMNNDYQQLGFIYNDHDRYPLYGRPKYRGKTDKYEYYIIDETRNRLKIPYKSRNDNELYDGDTITVDILKGSFMVKIYDYDNIRYDPDTY